MNIKEGTRRLGVVLGILGGAAGVYIGYAQEQPLWKARAAHSRLESVMALPTMQKVAKAARDYQNDWFVRNAPHPFSGRVDYGALATLPRGYVLDPPAKKDIFDTVENEQLERTESILVSVNLDGIKQVTVDKTGIVSSVELSSGELIVRVDPPPLRAYLVLLLYPVIGFLIPWGALKTITWIATGFVK